MPSGYKKRFRVTCFNYPQNEAKLIEVIECKVFSKIAFQEEKAPSTGRLHLQVYIETNVQRTYNFVRDKLRSYGWSDLHILPAEASAYANYQYVSKDDSYTGRYRLRRGTWVQPRSAQEGGRSGLSRMVDDLKAGRSEHYIAMHHTSAFLRHSRGVSRVISLLSDAKRRSERSSIACLWLCGSTGVGKSYWARQYAIWRRQEAFSLAMPEHAGGRIWFTGYVGQRVLLIDDIGYDSDGRRLFPRQWMLRATDSYRLQVPIHGSLIYAEWDTVIVTSNYTLETYYGNDEAINRRFTQVVNASERMELPDYTVDIPRRSIVPFVQPPQDVFEDDLPSLDNEPADPFRADLILGSDDDTPVFE